MLQEEQQVREPTCRGDVVEHVPDAVGQYRPPSERLRDLFLGHDPIILCISHGGSWVVLLAASECLELQFWILRQLNLH